MQEHQGCCVRPGYFLSKVFPIEEKKHDENV